MHMGHTFALSRYVVVVLFAAVVLTSCTTFSIDAPLNGSTVQNPVAAAVSIKPPDNYCGGFTAKLDGQDVTGLFSPMPSGGGAYLPNLAYGSHTLTASVQDQAITGFFICRTEMASVTFTIPPPFTLSASPNPLIVRRNSSSTLTVGVNRSAGFTGAVNVQVSGLPAGMTASPSTFQIPAALTTGSTLIIASQTATAGPSSGVLTGTSGVTTSFPLNVPGPTLTSITPSTPALGSLITIAGTNFDPTCSNNTVNITGPLGSVSGSPSGTCTSTLLSFQLPTTTPLGPDQISVSTNGLSSNTMLLSVARQTGLFAEITSGIEGNVSGTRMCSSGAVQLQFCGPGCAGYPAADIVATYINTSTGRPIGQPLVFQANNTQVIGVGGAGFGQCDVGIVLDGNASGYTAQLMSVQFLALVPGTLQGQIFPRGGYSFNYKTPAPGSYVPRIFQSPDGTLLIMVTASTLGPSQLTAAVFDLIHPTSAPDTTCTSLTNITNTFTAAVTSANQVAINLAGTSCTAVAIH